MLFPNFKILTKYMYMYDNYVIQVSTVSNNISHKSTNISWNYEYSLALACDKAMSYSVIHRHIIISGTSKWFLDRKDL